MLRLLFLNFIIYLSVQTASAATDAALSTLDLRVQRLENTLSTGGLLDLFQQVEQLRQQVDNLQGDLELQNHSLKQLETEQDKLISALSDKIQALDEAIANLKTSPSTEDDELIGLDNLSDETDVIANVQEPAIETQDSNLQLEKEAYQSAINLLSQSEYGKARDNLETFLSLYPDSSYADNAQYWLGESYYVQRDFENALLAYQALLDTYPDSTKASHALLKLAFSYDELEQTEKAIDSLNTIINNYPGSTVADQATERLRSLKSSSSE